MRRRSQPVTGLEIFSIEECTAVQRHGSRMYLARDEFSKEASAAGRGRGRRIGEKSMGRAWPGM